MNPSEKLSALLDRLIIDGEKMLADAKPGRSRGSAMVDSDAVRKWSNELRLFVSLAGPMVQPWRDRIAHNGGALILSSVEEPLAALQTVRYAIKEGLLFRFKELVLSEAFADLFEQGDYLLAQNYYLAAGVIFRAVLEERLRSLAEKCSCVQKKSKLTISDYNQALYTSNPPVYDKAMMLHVTALAAIGNDAAHNSPSLKPADVQRLRAGLQDFLARYSA